VCFAILGLQPQTFHNLSIADRIQSLDPGTCSGHPLLKRIEAAQGSTLTLARPTKMCIQRSMGYIYACLKGYKNFEKFGIRLVDYDFKGYQENYSGYPS
jgi:hypothetical protein